MAIRAAITVSVTSILLGLLFTHWIADSLTLWRTPVTDAHLWTAARYYHVLTKGPPGIGYVVVATASLGAVTILWSLRDGEAGNLMFDGGSIFLYGTAVAVYVQSVLPCTFRPPLVRVAHSHALALTSRLLAQLQAIFTNYVVLPPDLPAVKFPSHLRIPTLGLASSHLICSVALTGVLALQAGRWWAERADDDASTAETLGESARGISEKEGSRPDPKSARQGKVTVPAGLATVSTWGLVHE
ncbi:Shr3 amino acid permease chaperone [Russula earlei]|uniref:Shr3 amino acid permease chaperone n=1 Tax=Russula earlei TaxID=71964 RepID=A0ACC0U0N2_9AGAM|nr:Shr3 amino acid permease chaperone [Russula earlei]